MANKKITAMPSLAGNQVPTDLVTAVDLSAAPVNQNVKSTLNDLFATITKNITDRAIRFQAPGSAPAVSSANQGALYHNGTEFLASSNGGAYEPLYTLSAQSAALVFAGPTSGGAAAPTFRALALTDLPAGVGTVTSVGLSAPSIFTVANSPVTGSGTLALSLATQSAGLVFAGPTSGGAAAPTFRTLALTDLPQIATASLIGRSSAGTGTPEQITTTAALLTWLTNPNSANLLAAMTDETGAGTGNGLLVFNQSPVLVTPNIATIRTSGNQDALSLIGSTGPGGRNFVQITNGTQPNGPIVDAVGSGQADISLQIRSKGAGNVEITGTAVRAIGPTISGATNPGIVEALGGDQPFGGGKILLYERSINGTSYVGFEAPDSIASDIFWTLPATDGAAGQVLSTDGAGILSWATRGNGTVTSVGLSAPSIFTVANSPVTGSGTLALSLATQSAGLVFAGPTSGGAAAPTFRALALTDLPVIQFPAGTEAAPSITTTGDTNTGIYFPGADILGFVTGGQQRLRIGSTGNFAFGGAVATESRLVLAGQFPTGTPIPRAMRITGTFPETIATNALVIQSIPTIGAGAAIPTIGHFVASNAVGGTLTTQVGFWADTLTAGTSINYGFYGTATAAAGRWNFYAEGSAANYFAGNTGIGTTTFGTSAAGVLAIGNGTAPTTGPADTIQIYSTDLSAGNTMLSIYTEGTSVNANATAAATHRIAIRVNGTVYYLLANTAA